MTDCVFCKIVAGDIPSNKVFEDENFIAMMDIKPKSAGHVQVIPKQHFRWVWDVPNVGEYFEVARKIALAQKKAFETETVICNIVGEEVPHAHIWVFPDPRSGTGIKSDLAGNAELIKKHLS
ncbi:MAG: HIT domain-containing protein [Candidatus Doudnabacteria bacterium]|nr:HIT domain-containing protein [Candidatus Doudnabacteria bacterium]